MRLSCPSCGAHGSLEFFAGDAAAREASLLFGRLPAELAPLTQQYLALWRPRKQALRWQRVVKILGELVECIEAGHVERHGRTWPAPVPVWQRALESVLERRDKLSLPLTGHGYLYAIVTGDADKHEAQAEREAEEQVKAAGERRRIAINNARQEVAGVKDRAERLRVDPPTREQIAEIYRKYGVTPEEE
ncbi:hypothetical protein [Algiphilus sp.]|uniref:hypothetical protein n=1 Tax=Algiphilus sp. TaxID=1872431 RepID=UPI003C61E0F6